MCWRYMQLPLGSSDRKRCWLVCSGRRGKRPRLQAPKQSVLGLIEHLQAIHQWRSSKSGDDLDSMDGDTSRRVFVSPYRRPNGIWRLRFHQVNHALATASF